MEMLPESWGDIQTDTTYQTVNGLFASFANEQVKLGMKYDQKGKHLKAIEKGKLCRLGAAERNPTIMLGFTSLHPTYVNHNWFSNRTLTL